MRSRARGCTVQVHLWNGDPRGIRILSRAGWDGYLLIVPRTEVDTARAFEEELNQVGTVVLLGQTDNKRVCLRIAHADRAASQLAIFSAQARWTHMFLLGREGDFPRIVARQVALRLIQAARRSGLADVIDTYPTPPKQVTAAVRSTVDSYLRESLTLLALGGVDIFGEADVAGIDSSQRKPVVDVPVPHSPSISVNRPGPEQNQTRDLAVRPASAGTQQVTEKAHYDEDMQLLLHLGYLRVGQLIRFSQPRKGVIHKATVEPGGALRFQNTRYSSPSGAAVAASGSSTNGWTAWHTTDGRALDDLRRKARKKSGRS